jgi:hypothetical protein
MNKLNYGGPVVLVVMDGVGLSRKTEGNAVLKAHTEFLDSAVMTQKTMGLQASGEAVGILPGQMGNSEVGHNALGAGQIIKQGIAKIEDEFASGKIWESTGWTGAIANVKGNNSTLHFSGIFSDGGVHSDINHLMKMLSRASEEGVKRARIHLVLDGRDVPPKSAEKYVKTLEDFLDTLVDENGEKRDGIQCRRCVHHQGPPCRRKRRRRQRYFQDGRERRCRTEPGDRRGGQGNPDCPGKQTRRDPGAAPRNAVHP